VANEFSLAVLGMGVAVFRAALVLPATAFALAVSGLAVRATLARGGGPDAALGAVLQVWASPRARSIAIGLWLAGVLLWGALRVAWVAGAMPLVAWRLSGAQGRRPSLAAGAAWRFRRVLPVAAAAFLLDLAGRAMPILALVGAIAVGVRAQGSSQPGAAAFVAALALTSAVLLSAALSALGEVAVARAAMGGEGTGPALRGAARSFLHRPAAFLVALLAVGVATAAIALSAQAVLGGMGRIAAGGPSSLLLVPNAILAALAALVAAASELWRLATVGVLALAPQDGGENRWMILRSESLGMRPPSQ
jgi:hypothetical protein